MDGLDRSAMCGSPLRQLSPLEKESLRSRIIKETPQRFYSNQSILQSEKEENTITQFKDEVVEVPPSSPSLQNNKSTNRLPGFFENPILTKFINKSINKEFEFHKLIINIVSLFTITLLIKFIKLIYQIYNNYYYNKFSQQSFLEKLIPCDDTDNLQSFSTSTTSFCHSYSFFGWNNWQFYIINLIKFLIYILNNIDKIKKFVNFIITFNIIVSLGKLISYSQRSIRNDDNNNNNMISHNHSNLNDLSSRQKDLLGLDENLSNNNINNNEIKNKNNNSKPHEIILNDKFNNTNNNNNHTRRKLVPPPTPYLFKSLRTPLKRDQQKQEQAKLQQQQSTFRMNVPSTMPHKYNGNIFNNTNNNTTLINNNNISSHNTNKNVGYIPSNKYAYMMNSPSPMKKR